MNILTKNQLLTMNIAIVTMMAGFPESTEMLSKILIESTNCAKNEARDQKALNKLLLAEDFISLCNGKSLLDAVVNGDSELQSAESIQKMVADGKPNEVVEEAKPVVALIEGATLTAETGGMVATLAVTSVAALPAPEAPVDEAVADKKPAKAESMEFGCMIVKIMEDGIAERKKAAAKKPLAA